MKTVVHQSPNLSDHVMKEIGQAHTKLAQPQLSGITGYRNSGRFATAS